MLCSVSVLLDAMVEDTSSDMAGEPISVDKSDNMEESVLGATRSELVEADV